MKKFEGIVIGTKMNKTATVLVEKRRPHPIYQKRIKLTKKYHAHDEIGVKVGDKVKIIETRPISKTKKWKILEVKK